MEALTFQQMLEQPPSFQVLERSPFPPNGRFTQEIQPHEWSLKKLRLFATEVRNVVSEMDDAVQVTEVFATKINEIGIYGLDLMFSDYTEEKLEESWQTNEKFLRELAAFGTFLNDWEEGLDGRISKLKERRDVPNQLMMRLETSQRNLRSLRLRYEESWAVLQIYEIPVRSSILLALAKFRELTSEEKKMLLKSAVYHGPIDNPPSDYREDWYDDHGR